MLSSQASICSTDDEQGNGFVGGVNIDLPYWGPFEVRGAVRFNTVQRPDKDYTGWIDIGISLGYEL